MPLMKCRCGSGDKIKFEGGKLIREDDKPHICLHEIDKIPQYKAKIVELQNINKGLLEHNNYLQSKSTITN